MLAILISVGAATASAQTVGSVARDLADLDTLLALPSTDSPIVQVDDMIFSRPALQAYRDALAAGGRAKSSFSNPWRLWPGGRVPYLFVPGMSDQKQSLFEQSLREWQRVADLNFVPRTTEPNYIAVTSTTNDMSSSVGMTGGAQTLRFADWGYKIASAHEVAHALGVIHEQSRSDRDSYVEIITANIEPAMLHNFTRVPGSYNQGPYDYGSIMHYSRSAFPLDRTGTTIRTLDPTWQDRIGLASQLSTLDKAGMAAIYGPALSVSGSLSYGGIRPLRWVTIQLDGGSGNPYRGTTVMSSTNGEFVFQGVCSGTYRLIAHATTPVPVDVTQTIAVAQANLTGVALISPDITPPAVTFSSLSEGAVVAQLNPIRGHVTDDLAVGSVMLFLQEAAAPPLPARWWNGTAWQDTPISLPTSITGTNWLWLGATAPLLKCGGHYVITATASDASGNVTPLSATVAADSTPPMFSITSHTNNQIVTDLRGFGGVVADTGGALAGVACAVRGYTDYGGPLGWWNGASFQPSFTSLPCVYDAAGAAAGQAVAWNNTPSAPLPVVAPGEHFELEAWAWDVTGCTSSASVTLRVQSTEVQSTPGTDGPVYALAVQADGRFFAGGDFTTLSTTLGSWPRNSLGRVLHAGSVDTFFNAAITPDTVAGDDVLCLAVQPDGKLLLGGQHFVFGLSQEPYLAQLQPDGWLDWSFSAMPSGPIRALALQSDGEIVVAGEYPSERLRRYHPDGSLDAAFLPTAGSQINCMAVEPDGKIIVGGLFTALNGQARNYLGRLLPDGTLDNTFNPGPDGEVHTLVVQPDGKIIVGGDFTMIGGQSHARLARLEPNGAVESWFNTGVGANWRVETIALQADGRIVVGGAFSQLHGQSREGLGRLLSDGSLDESFDPVGTYATVHALALEADGRLIVGGEFSQLAGMSANNLGRLGLGRAPQSFYRNGDRLTWLRGGASPEVWRTTFDYSTNGTDWIPLGAGTRIVGGWETAGVSAPAGANLRARGWTTGGRGNGSAWFVEALLAPPIITLQPESQSRCPGPGQGTTFTVSAAGNGPFSYQWRKNGVNLADGPLDGGYVQGATTPTLQLSPLGADTAGAYDVVVVNSRGSVASEVATLTIAMPPVLVTQPASFVRQAGESVTLEVVVDRPVFVSYQWRRDGQPLSGQTGPRLQLPNLRLADMAAYDVVVQTPCGESVTSGLATVTIEYAPTVLSQWPGFARGTALAVTVVGTTAYVAAEEGGLVILDVSNPAHPVRLGGYDTRSSASGVQLVGNLAFVADGGAGLQVIDVSNPANLERVGGFFTSGWAWSVQVVGNLAYVASSDAGLEVIDISNAANPLRVGGYYTSGYTLGVQVVGNLAFVADGHAGLQVIDVSNPANPVRVGGYDTSSFAYGVQVVGNLAFVADGLAGLQVIDVSNPANPVHVGGYDTSIYARGLQVVANLAFVADVNAGLQVIDVSNPASPVRVGGHHTSGHACGVQVVGNLAYLADGYEGLQVIDVSNAANPLHAGGYDTSGETHDVQVVGNLAYLADGSAGLNVIDVSNPASPVRVGGYRTSGDAYGVQVVGNLAYLADVSAGLNVIDVSNPASPVRVGVYHSSGDAYGVQVVGNLAYLADGTEGLQVIDVSNAAHPVRVGAHDTSGSAHSVQVVGNLVYMANSDAGLEVIDVSDAAHPVRVGGYDPSSFAYGVQVVGTLAYLTDGWAGLQVVDVSNPASPVRVGGCDTSGYAWGVQVVGNLVYMANSDAGLQLIHVSNPANPVLAGGCSTSGWASRVQVVGNLAYVANGSRGLAIVQIREELPTIIRHPESRENTVGTTATFSVGAAGAPLLRYQWLFDGEPLAGETNAVLTFNVSDSNQAGEYSVTVSNDFGSETSHAATLVVPLTPPAAIAATLTEGMLELRWSRETLNWRLEAQTNSPGDGLGAQWITVPGSTATNHMRFPVGTAGGSAFYRLVFP